MEIEVGGQIQGISLGSFLQIVNMDKTSCTLKIYSSDIIGYLYIVDGELVAAETGNLKNVEAAYEIISWNNTMILIDNAPPPDQNIKMPLMSILMEGLRLKDEKNAKKSLKKENVEKSQDEEHGIEFDPDNYASKDDEITSKFCEPAEDPGENDIVLDYSSVEIDEPPPVMPETEEPKLEMQKREAEEDIPVAAKSDLPDDVSLPPVLPDEEGLVQEEIDDSEESLMEFDDEVPPAKTDLKKMVKVAAWLFTIGLIIIFLGPNIYTNYKLRDEYTKLMHSVDKTNNNNSKSTLLKRYLKTHGDNAYIKKVTDDLNQISTLIKIDKKIRAFEIDNTFLARAKEEYKSFLKQFPDGKYKQQALKKMNNLPEVVDEIDFKALIKMKDLSKKEKLAKYKKYLKDHPKGKYVQQVENLIAAVGDDYFEMLQEKLIECDKNKDWEECILLSGIFINNFTTDPRIVEIRILRDKLYDKTDFENMKKKERGMKYKEAKNMFVSYLKKHPESSVNNEINAEIFNINKKIELQEQWNDIKSYSLNKDIKIDLRINEVKQFIDFNPESPFLTQAKKLLKKLKYREKNLQTLIVKAQQKELEEKKKALLKKEQQRLAEERERQRLAKIAREKKEARLKIAEKKFAESIDSLSNRFLNNGDRTITDSRTGLTWVMLDSLLESGRCVNYKTAKKYVDKLNTGGYSDWRLPSPNELAVFYNSPPYYPESGANWYWTSKTTAGAWGQNKKVVIFRPNLKNVFNSEYKDPGECGYIHAVRK